MLSFHKRTSRRNRRDELEENRMKSQKKTPEVPDIMNLPKPQPGKGGGRKAGVLALVAVLAVGGAAF